MTITEKEKPIGPLTRLARRFARSDRGVTAIEFALVGPVFFAIIGATIETALVFFAGYALDTAVIDSSRLIRTGQLSRVASAEDYRREVCGRLYGMFDCDQLRIAVTEINDFADFSPSDPIEQASGAWVMSVDQPLPAFAGSKNYIIEAYYKWPTIMNVPGLNAGQMADGKRLLATSHVIQTEPF
ncbi:pilus assembly protein [Pelagibacterium sp. 26DY04]|nr:pilus assembly protein [Pelagibacterium sp. 26DY04]WMT87421.1 pilus assembly protein [Pelagibacterium sp. 26DY04]